MEPRISLITLGVADLERATRFYEECLGLPRLQTLRRDRIGRRRAAARFAVADMQAVPETS